MDNHKMSDAIGRLPNGELIYPEEGLELDSPQAIEEYVNRKIKEFREYHVKCYHCGTWIPRDEAECDYDGNDFCSSCYERHCHTCEDCDEVFYEDNMTRLGDKWFCDARVGDYAVCMDCGEVHKKSEMRRYHGDYICEDCYDSNYYTCCSCGCVVHCDDVVVRNDEDYCPDCAPCEDDLTGVVGYHEFENNGGEYVKRKINTDKDDCHNNLFLGVELECDTESDDDDRFDPSYFSWWFDQNFLVHFEQDGSLSDNGIECITQPCTLKFHQQRMRWDELCRKIVGQGYKSHDTDCCGLHVHMSRSGLTPIQIIKMDVFINRGIDFWSQIGRRREIYSGRYDVNKVAKKSKGFQGSCRDGSCGYCSDDRYVPVNTRNISTVEVRIFKGTLCSETILGTLELLDALPKFLDTVPICEIYETRKLIAKYIRYIGDNYAKYPNAIPMMRRLIKYEWNTMVNKIYNEHTNFNNNKEI